MIRPDTALQLHLVGALIVQQPFQSLFCAFVGRKDGIKNLCNAAVIDHQGQPFNEGHGVELEGREFERTDEKQFLITQQRVGKVESLGRFTLVVGVLGAQPEYVRSARAD